MENDKILPKGAWLGKTFQPLIFCEGPWLCEVCNKFGYDTCNCSQDPKKWNYKMHNPRPQGIDEEEDRGNKWEKVNKKEKGKKVKESQQGEGTNNTCWTPKKIKEVGLNITQEKGDEIFEKGKKTNGDTSLVLGKEKENYVLANSFSALQESEDLGASLISAEIEELTSKGGKSGTHAEPSIPKTSHQNPSTSKLQNSKTNTNKPCSPQRNNTEKTQEKQSTLCFSCVFSVLFL